MLPAGSRGHGCNDPLHGRGINIAHAIASLSPYVSGL